MVTRGNSSLKKKKKIGFNREVQRSWKYIAGAGDNVEQYLCIDKDFIFKRLELERRIN